MPFSPQSKNYGVQKKLVPVSMGSEHDLDLDIKGLAIDRAEAVVELILNEVMPDTATTDADIGLINKYEELLGIISNNSLSIDDRRKNIVAKLVSPSGISAAFYYQIAEKLEYHIYPDTTPPYIQIQKGITRPFRVGLSKIGIDSLYDQSSGFSGINWKVIGSNVETDSVLQSIFQNLQPANGEVVFENA